MLIVRRKCHAPAPPDVTLVMSFERRQHTRLRTTLADGEEIGLFLERGTSLRDGDLLAAEDGRVVAVVAAEEELFEVRAGDGLALARAAYHLGNRHVVVEIAPGRLRFPANAIFADLLRGLGFEVTAVRAAFQPESGAYAAEGHLHAGDGRHAGVIHDFGTPDAHP
ncbi:MAG: urease accessory protein UreE [Betaproteobacteria bacterium]